MPSPFLTWGRRLLCPATGPWRTSVSAGCQTNNECENYVCRAGYICHNNSGMIPSLRPEPCPVGHVCRNGVNESQPCRTAWFGSVSAEERCPRSADGLRGTAYEPPSADYLAILAVWLVPFMCLLELVSCVEKSARKNKDGVFNAPANADDPSNEQEHVPLDEQGGGAWWNVAKQTGDVKDGLIGGVARARERSQSLIGGVMASVEKKPLLQLGNVAAAKLEGGLGAAASAINEVTQIARLSRGGAPAEEQKALTRGRALLKLTLNRLTFSLGGKRVLNDVSVTMRQGELVALMGESGCGKSTLLNVLGGRANYGIVGGVDKNAPPISLNSRPFQPDSMRNLLGFVPQEHLVFKELTVYENLLYSAMLRLRVAGEEGEPISPSYRDELIESALVILRLQDKRHFLCDPHLGERLSGGEMRRVGIGIEFVCDPPIMLLDEPTSALDAVNTRMVVQALKDLANRGVLVMASLHQPRRIVYEMLDRLLLLRKGVLIYGGYVLDAPSYFIELGYNVPDDSNPADFFIEVAFGFEKSKKRLRELVESPSSRAKPGYEYERDCFGLRLQGNHLTGLDELNAENKRVEMRKGLPDIKADDYVRADTLGTLWRQWHRTGVRSASHVLEYLANRSNVNRAFFLKLMQRINSKQDGATKPKQVKQGRRKSVTVEAVTDPAAAPGVKFRNCGEERPTKGTPLENDNLATALVAKSAERQHAVKPGAVIEFSADEWAKFEISDLHCSDFIKAGDAYYQTAPGGDVDVTLLGVTYPEFEAWFMSPDGFGRSLRRKLARQAWDRAAQKAEAQGKQKGTRRINGVQPTWHQLRVEIDQAPLGAGDYPNWFVHFGICLRRYLLKVLRTRARVHTLLILTIVLGIVCGSLHGSPPARNDLITYYMLFNCLFAVIPCLGASTTFASGNGFFKHEAVSGVRQSAEGLARMLIDTVWLALIPPVFIQTMRAFAILRMELYATYYLTAWAVVPIGYLFSIVSPNNGVVITAAVVILMFNVGNGFFGLRAIDLSGFALRVLKVTPGFNAFQLVSFGACVAEPFDTTRWFIMNQLRTVGVIPQGVDEIHTYETQNTWRVEAQLRLVWFGLVLRILVLIIFVFQPNTSIKDMINSLRIKISECWASCKKKKDADAVAAPSKAKQAPKFMPLPKRAAPRTATKLIEGASTSERDGRPTLHELSSETNKEAEGSPEGGDKPTWPKARSVPDGLPQDAPKDLPQRKMSDARTGQMSWLERELSRQMPGS